MSVAHVHSDIMQCNRFCCASYGAIPVEPYRYVHCGDQVWIRCILGSPHIDKDAEVRRRVIAFCRAQLFAVLGRAVYGQDCHFGRCKCVSPLLDFFHCRLDEEFAVCLEHVYRLLSGLRSLRLHLFLQACVLGVCCQGKVVFSELIP